MSLFEEHTSIIRRGKAGKETEYGHKVWLEETEGGIISGYRVLEGNPAFALHFNASDALSDSQRNYAESQLKLFKAWYAKWSVGK